MKPRDFAALFVCAAASLPLVSCKSSGGNSSSRSMASLPEGTKSQVAGYLGAAAGLNHVLAGITDSPSASAAMPTLKEYIEKVSTLARDIDALPPDSRQQISRAYAPQFATQNDAFEDQVNRIKGTPGLGTQLGPLLDKVTLLR